MEAHKTISVSDKQSVIPFFGNLSHAELVKACSESSNHPAWSEFHRRYGNFIRLYVKKEWRNRGASEGSCARETIKDLAQEVYMKIIEDDQQALKNFKGVNENSFLAYLARIAINIVAEHFRKQQAEKRKGQNLSIEVLSDEKAHPQSLSRSIVYTYLSCNSEMEFITGITAKQLSNMLDEILGGPNRKRDKLIFKLHIVDGLSAQQVAAAHGLGLKASSVESIIRRTRARLRQALWAKSSPLKRGRI